MILSQQALQGFLAALDAPQLRLLVEKMLTSPVKKEGEKATFEAGELNYISTGRLEGEPLEPGAMEEIQLSENEEEELDEFLDAEDEFEAYTNQETDEDLKQPAKFSELKIGDLFKFKDDEQLPILRVVRITRCYIMYARESGGKKIHRRIKSSESVKLFEISI